MLLIDPVEAALAIAANCNGAVGDNEQLILVLKYVTPRIEDAMNVASLVRGDFIDSFYLPAMNSRCDRQIARLRLSNGYLLGGAPLTITDSDGEAIDPTFIELVDEENGVIELNQWTKGRWSVAYTSGFEVPALPDPLPDGYDPDARVLLAVPEWIHALCAALVIQWYRASVVSPKLPKNVSLTALDQMLRKEIYMRVYGRYLRPRVNCFFSEKLTYAA